MASREAERAVTVRGDWYMQFARDDKPVALPACGTSRRATPNAKTLDVERFDEKPKPRTRRLVSKSTRLSKQSF